MRLFKNGSYYSVQVTRSDVERFASCWPCFGRVRPFTFTFHRDSGDLVDMSPPHFIGENDDNGVLALCAEAQEYARERLG